MKTLILLLCLVCCAKEPMNECYLNAFSARTCSDQPDGSRIWIVEKQWQAEHSIAMSECEEMIIRMRALSPDRYQVDGKEITVDQLIFCNCTQ